MHKIIRFIRQLSYSIITPPPISKKLIALFDAFAGQYTCNPKYILLKLHEKAPNIKAYFLVSQKHNPADSLPDFVRPVRYGSLKHRLLWRRCNVFVTNGVSIANEESPALQISRPKIYKAFLKKKLIISTWHGSGALKKCWLDEVRRHSDGIQRPESEVFTDFLLAGGRKSAAVLSTFINRRKPFPVSLTGTPRCDILVNGNADVAALKEKLCLPKNKKIILFAPTFRSKLGSNGENAYESGIRQMEALDVERLLDALSERFGGEWAFALRAHHAVVVEMRDRRSEMPAVIDGNIGDDMMEYLLCADVLLTDYSSSMADFALTRRPCFLFALDRAHYENEERGFYFDYDSLPFPFADSCNALIGNIRAFDEVTYKEGIAKYLDMLGRVEDGKAAERVADCILHYVRTGEKRLETVDGVEER